MGSQNNQIFVEDNSEIDKIIRNPRGTDQEALNWNNNMAHLTADGDIGNELELAEVFKRVDIDAYVANCHIETVIS